MSRMIPITLQVRGKGKRIVQITPNWAGKNLAIHKPVFIDGDDQPGFEETRSLWCITHVYSGMSAGRFEGSLDRAKAFARQWDKAWDVVTGCKVPVVLRRDYLSALAAASNGPSRKDIIEAEA